MDYSTSGFPIPRHLPEFAQLWVALDQKKKKMQGERLSPTLFEVLDPAVPETALILSWTVEFHEPMIPNPIPLLCFLKLVELIFYYFLLIPE